jgi:hypothetical protein
MQLEITDSASQEKKILEFDGTFSVSNFYYDLNAQDSFGYRNWIRFGLEPFVYTQTFDLGNNRYTFSGFSRKQEQELLWADISVSPLVQTPEPSTLLLAGLGLSAFAFRKRWFEVGVASRATPKLAQKGSQNPLAEDRFWKMLQAFRDFPAWCRSAHGTYLRLQLVRSQFAQVFKEQNH